MKVTEEVAVSVRQGVEPKEGNIVRYKVDSMIVDGMYLTSFFEDRGFDTKESVEFHEVFVFETGYVEKLFAFELLGVLEL